MELVRARIVTLCMLVIGGVVLLWLPGCCRVRKEAPETKAEVEKPPVVQVAQMPEKEPGAEPFVANPFCYACHADFEGEKLVARHEKAGIGCERCHGESDRHRSDEANITPPELMYPRARINPTCMMCHPRQKIEHVKMHGVILEGAATIFDEQAPQGPAKVCTDCHAREHRMNVRTVCWDKTTGELLGKK